MSEEIARDLGAHAEAIDTLKEDMREVKAALARVEAKLQQTEGAWKMLLGVSAASSAITAAAFKMWGVMKGGV